MCFIAVIVWWAINLGCFQVTRWLYYLISHRRNCSDRCLKLSISTLDLISWVMDTRHLCPQLLQNSFVMMIITPIPYLFSHLPLITRLTLPLLLPLPSSNHKIMSPFPSSSSLNNNHLHPPPIPFSPLQPSLP